MEHQGEHNAEIMNNDEDSQAQASLRKLVLVEAAIFATLGVTSFLALIFLSTQAKAYYIIGVIVYGAVNLIGGSIGVYGIFYILCRWVKVYLVFVGMFVILNSLAIAAYVALFVDYVQKGYPEGERESVKVWYVFKVMYYLFEAFMSIGLVVFACFSFSQSRKFIQKANSR